MAGPIALPRCQRHAHSRRYDKPVVQRVSGGLSMRASSPSALTLLCAVQGCERFAFTAILPLFVLYLHRRHGFTEPTALLIIGLFTALSYASGLPGGMLTDRRLDPRSGLLIGSVLLMLG